DLPSLGHLDDTGTHDQVRRRARDVAAVEADPALSRHEAADRGEGARLRRPARSDERSYRASIRRERDAVYRLDRTVTDAKVFDLEKRRAHAASSFPRYASRTIGLACISTGVPSAIFRPKLSTATRSHVPITRRTSCSMSTIVSPSATSARMSSRSRADSAGVDTKMAADEIHECGLAGAVRTDESEHLTGSDSEVDLRDGVHAAEPLRDAVALKQHPPLRSPAGGGSCEARQVSRGRAAHR